MTALTTDRDTPKFYSERVVHAPIAAASRVRRGALAMFNGSGYVVKASDSAVAGVRVVGVSKGDYDNSGGAAGDVEGDFEPGVYGFNAAAGLAAAARANVGKVVFVVDDNTVGLAADTVNSVPAGLLEEVTNGVYRVRVGDRAGASGDGDLAALDEVGTAQLADAVADIIAGAPTIALGAEAGDARVATVQCKDAQGNDLAARQLVTWWLSDAAAGAPSGDAPSGGTAVTTGVALKEHTAEVFGEAMTDENGVLALTITEAAADSWFLNVEVGGRITTSDEIAFA